MGGEIYQMNGSGGILRTLSYIW